MKKIENEKTLLKSIWEILIKAAAEEKKNQAKKQSNRYKQSSSTT